MYLSTDLMASPLSNQHQFYQLTPVKLGAEVRGIALSDDVPTQVVEQIKNDVHKHRLLIFKNQGVISGDRHVEISRWFAPLDSTFYKHPKAPHPDVFRVSNDETEGCTGVGRTGWHIDGSFQESPFAYALYHIVHAAQKGNTVFAPLREIITGLPKQQQERWERLWMVSDKREDRIHPMIYSHPVTGLKTLCFHVGMTEAFVWDHGSPEERWTDWPETLKILHELNHEFVKNNGAIQYSHKWEPGDFIISDNLAVGHEASAETQLPRSQMGLRVLHRTTVQGRGPPVKEYQLVQGNGNNKEQ